MITFNNPPVIDKGFHYIKEAVYENNKTSGDGFFTEKCNEWIEENLKTYKSLLTTSCTHALEMTAMLIDIKPGDEVIAPSYTFVSTVNAFVLRGAKIVFVDIRPDTMNIDESLIEQAISPKTKAIIPVHYAGVACEMDTIMNIAKRYNLYVIEDAAQAVMSSYKGKALGTIGDFGCFSFHETKNYSMGEGGALLIQNKKFKEKAEIIREKGTNRSRFIRGQVDKYTWVDVGSSYLPSELNAAFLFAQLEEASTINMNRTNSWELYYEGLKDLHQKQIIKLPTVPKSAEHNAHMFYIKCNSLKERANLISFLRENDISATFHYIPLHTSEAGIKYTKFVGEDIYTTSESEKLLRLPLYYKMEEKSVKKVINAINSFYEKPSDKSY